MTESAPFLAVSGAQEEFSPEVVYLNTASLGLPPRRSLAAVQAALEQWRAGRANPPEYDEPLARARAAYAAVGRGEPPRGPRSRWRGRGRRTRRWCGSTPRGWQSKAR